MYLELVCNNHFSNEFSYLLAGHFKHFIILNFGKGDNAEGLILASGAEKEGFKGRFLEGNG